MADVQRENGHLDIANALAEAFARQVISPDEWRILWVIIRKTYGWQKKTDWISLSQFSLSTGMKKAHVCRAVKKLISRNIVTQTGNGITQTGNGQGYTYALQKDFDLWKALPKQVKALPKQVTTITQTGNLALPKQGTTNTTITNTTITKTTIPNRPVIFPISLDIPKFKEIWELWRKYRFEIRKPLKPTGEAMALKKLAEYPVDTAIKAVETSIANQWQGIFPEKFKAPEPRPEEPPEEHWMTEEEEALALKTGRITRSLCTWPSNKNSKPRETHGS